MKTKLVNYLRIGTGLALLICASPIMGAELTTRDAIKWAQMPSMITHIMERYDDLGLSWNEAIEWHIEDYTTTLWYYDRNEQEILVGEVPTPDQLTTYWQAWSDALTGGNFDPDSFFVDVEEAQIMAQFNQFVLATHESAHAITYRYDPEHAARHDYDINCREYYADRLTISLINDAANDSEDVRQWLNRYHELVVAMGNTIPQESRVSIPNAKALNKDCGVISIRQPSPDDLQQYASAFFERYRVFLDAPIMPLAELVDKQLVSVQRDKFERMPLTEDASNYELSGFVSVPNIRVGTLYGDIPAGVLATQAIDISPEGDVYALQMHYDRQSDLIEFRLGKVGTEPQTILTGVKWPRHEAFLEMSSMAIRNMDEIWLVFEEYDNGITLARLQNLAKGWTFNSVEHVETFDEASILRKPDQSFALALTDYPLDNGELDETWRVVPFDPDNYDASEFVDLPVAIDDPIAVDQSNRLYFDHGNAVMRIDENGGFRTFVGNFLMGQKNGSMPDAEIFWVEKMQFMPDGTALLLDHDPRTWDFLNLRTLSPLE